MTEAPNDFYEDEEDIALLQEMLEAGPTGQTTPSVAFLRQVREAIAYSYQAGELPASLPDSVRRYCEGDGGYLLTLDAAIRLAEERELAEIDASLIDAVAKLLDAQDTAGGGSRWDEEDPPGWASREALREAYRAYAREVLALAAPRIARIVAERYEKAQLPQYRDIVGRHAAPE